MENSMEFNGIQCNEIPLNFSLNCMEFHWIWWNWGWWNSMKFNGIPWKIQWNFMEFNGIPWNAVNWRNLMEFGFDRVYSPCLNSTRIWRVGDWLSAPLELNSWKAIPCRQLYPAKSYPPRQFNLERRTVVRTTMALCSFSHHVASE
jgi:hypothetical protein